MSVLDFTDLTACANKVRQPGYWHVGASVIDSVEFPAMPALIKTWVPNVMTKNCNYDRKAIDPACINCKRIDGVTE